MAKGQNETQTDSADNERIDGSTAARRMRECSLWEDNDARVAGCGGRAKMRQHSAPAVVIIRTSFEANSSESKNQKLK